MLDEVFRAALPTLIEYGVPIVGTALSALLGMVLTEARKHFKSAASTSALDRLERVALLAVHDVEQTIMPGLKAAAADGKITREEAVGLRLAALNSVKKILGDQGLKEMRAANEDLETVLGHIIEAKVRELRVRQSYVPGALTEFEINTGDES